MRMGVGSQGLLKVPFSGELAASHFHFFPLGVNHGGTTDKAIEDFFVPSGEKLVSLTPGVNIRKPNPVAVLVYEKKITIIWTTL